MKTSALLIAAIAALSAWPAQANDRAPSGIQANKARAMAEYWRHPTKPQVQQVESRSLTGKKSCEMKIGAPAPEPGAAARPPARSEDNVIIIREAVVNRC
jgi:hypothetical protein